MSKITDSYINDHIKKAIDQMVPAMPDDLWERPIEKATKDAWFLDGIEKQHKKTYKNVGKIVRQMSALAACLMLCFLMYYVVELRVETTVYLDVNPSVQIEMNSEKKVLHAIPNNQDGEIILDGMDLRKTDVDVAINAVLGSMIKHGYLSEAKNMILLSVEGRNEQKAEALRIHLAEEIHACLSSMMGANMVFDQQIEKNDTIEALAEKHKISLGKASLLQKILDLDEEFDEEELAKMTIAELTEYLKKQGIDLKQYVNYTGTKDEIEKFEKAENEDQEEMIEEETEKIEKDEKIEIKDNQEEKDENEDVKEQDKEMEIETDDTKKPEQEEPSETEEESSEKGEVSDASEPQESEEIDDE